MKHLFLPSILIIGLLLRINFLNQHDIWFDEAFSFFVAKSSLHDLLTATAADNNPPFYYLLLHSWMDIFGTGMISLRAPSLIFGVLSIAIFFKLTDKLFNSKIAIFSSSIFTLSPLMIYYSTEARMYSLIVFLGLVSTYSWISLLKKQSIHTSLIFLLSFTLALYTHYYSFLLFLPYIALLYIIPRKKKLWPFFLLLIPGLLTIPWLLDFLQNQHPDIYAQSNIIAIPATIASFVLGGTGNIGLRTFFSQSVPIWIKTIFVLSLIAFSVGFLKGTLLAKKTNEGKILLYLLLIPLFTLTIINIFIPVFSVRSTILFAPFFYQILGLGIYNLQPSKRIYYFILLIILLASIFFISITYTPFHGTPIQAALKKIDNNTPLAHTSILTYYPVLYYFPEWENKNYLISTNPLSDKTIAIIGGKKQLIKSSLSKFSLMDITGGLDEIELQKTKQYIDKRYKINKKVTFDVLTISNYEKR